MYSLRKKKNRFHVLKDKMKEAGTSFLFHSRSQDTFCFVDASNQSGLQLYSCTDGLLNANLNQNLELIRLIKALNQKDKSQLACDHQHRENQSGEFL